MRTCSAVPVILLAAGCCLCALAGSAGAGCAPDSIWMKTYGAGDETLRAVHNTPDGGLIMGGTTSTYGAGDSDLWLVKTNADGETLWTRTYGSGDREFLYDLQVVPAGGYVMCGRWETGFAEDSTVSWVVRTDEAGDTLWTWRHSDLVGLEWAAAVEPLSDGRFAVAANVDAGSGTTDAVLYLLTSDGALADSNRFGGASHDIVMAVSATPDGGFAVAGWTASYGAGSFDAYLVKTDASCDLVWEKWYGGASSDQARNFMVTPDGGFVLAGSTSSYGAGSSDCYIVRIDSAGDTLWTRTAGGLYADIGMCLAEATDGTIVVAGETDSFGEGTGSFYIVALDSAGTVHCTGDYGTTGRDVAIAIVETPDQGFVLAGSTIPDGTTDWYGLAVRVYGQAPLIHSIADVPYDQGGKVRLVWGRSSHDTPGGDPTITGYAVYRKYDWAALGESARVRADEREDGEGTREAAAPASLLGLTYPPGNWDYVTTVPARCEDVYSTVVPTLCDSSVAYGVCWSFFFVSALTAEPSFYFDSPPDSGYSVDNLAPSPPAGLYMPTDTDLAWDEAPEADFDYFTVYGSDGPDFAGVSLLGYTSATGFDVSADFYNYYHVTATDFSGNEGGPATVENAFAGAPGGKPAEMPTACALRQNEPNPFAASTVVAFDLPAAGPVKIEVADVEGRIVRTLVGRSMPAGRHTATWDGCDAAGAKVGPGVYFVRMTAGEFAATCKMLCLR